MELETNASLVNGTLTKEYLERLLKYENDRNAIRLLPVILYVAILMVFGFMGNSVVFYVYRMKSKQTTKGVFIYTLAVLDLMNCCFSMPFEIVDLRNQYCFHSGVFCKIMRSIETALVLSAGFTLVAVSVDRYLNLCRRQSRLLFTPSRAKKVCVFCIFLSVVFAWPTAIFAGEGKITIEVNGTRVEGTECTSFMEENPLGMNPKAYIFALNTVFFVSLMTMSSLYISIATKLFRRRRGSVHNGLLFVQTSKEAEKLQLGTTRKDIDLEKCGYAIGKRGIKMKGSTVIFYSVTIVFILGFLPHLVVRIIKLTGGEFVGHGMDLLYNFCVRSYLINSAANPFIYSLLHTRFRKEVKHTFQNCFKCSSCCRWKRLNKSVFNCFPPSSFQWCIEYISLIIVSFFKDILINTSFFFKFPL